MEITISFDTSKLDRLLSDFPYALADAQKNALKSIGDEVASQATRAFKDPVYRPSPWAPRKMGGDWPLLVKHPNGGLKASIIPRGVGNDTVVVGTDKKYASFHQFGTKKMPARPFFPIDAHGDLTPRMMRKIQKLASEALEDELRKIGFR